MINGALPWRLARRELRGGLSGFRIFLACVFLGVAAIATVGSVSEAMIDGLRQNARAILGADLEVRLVHRAASADQQAFLEAQATLSRSVRLRAMARAERPDARRKLIELRGVDDAYPLYGEVVLDPPMSLAEALEQRDGLWGMAVDGNLLPRLGVELGDRIRVGDGLFEVRAVIAIASDRASRSFLLGPGALAGFDSLEATGLIQPGSLIYHYYRLRLPEGGDAQALKASLNAAFPDAGWRLRDPTQAAPGVQRFIDRVTLFLTLVGLTALLVVGVGVGNAVLSYLEGKTASIATLKCLGAPGRLIFRVYLIQILILAVLGIAAGLAVGLAAPLIVDSLVGDALGWRAGTGIYPVALLLAAGFGGLTALTFSLWPLARAQAIAPAALFRDLVLPARGALPARARLLIVISALLLAGLAVWSASDKAVALWFVAGALGALALFRLAAQAVVATARRLPRPRRPGLRLVLANLHRPGAPTASVVLSLGLGLTVLVAIALIEGNLARQIDRSLPEEAPAFYFIDIQPDQVEDFERIVSNQAGVRDLRRVPMLRGRITRIKGQPPEAYDVPSNLAWVFRGDRGLTWSAEPPEGSEIVAGDWWPADHAGPPLVSLDAELGEALDLEIGDQLTVNILGRQVDVAIANFRRIEWGTLSINFVMVFSPGLLEGAPQTQIATVKLDAEQEEALEQAVSDALPNVSAIRIREVLSTVSELMGRLALAVRAIAGLTLAAGILVLAGAIAAGRRRRRYDAVVLKVLGATRRGLAQAFLAEYGLLGLVTAVIAAVLGTLAAFVVLTFVMNAAFIFLPVAIALTLVVGTVATLLIGFLGTWQALSQKAAPLLRNE